MEKPDFPNKKGRRIGFLDLPAELRLPIYDHLLSRRDAILYIDHTPAGSLCTVGICFASPRQVPSDDHALHEDVCLNYPSSAILSTCRTIAAEAAPILYLENNFQFDCLSRLYPDSHELRDMIQQACSRLFTHYCPPTSDEARMLGSSTFAAFIKAIGPQNAGRWTPEYHWFYQGRSSNTWSKRRLNFYRALSWPSTDDVDSLADSNLALGCLTSLSFAGTDANYIANQMPTITGLVSNHARSLRCLEINVDSNAGNQGSEYPISANFLEYWYKPQYVTDSGHSVLSMFPHLAGELEIFVNMVTWLRELRFTGRDFRIFKETHLPHMGMEIRRITGAVIGIGGSDWKRFQDLEDLVKSRMALGGASSAG